MEPTAEPRSGERWLGALFLALALLYVVPFWIVHYLPTADGPCHTYNAWILRHYGDVQRYPLFQQYYRINAEPYPNWLGHGLMALLMFVVPPLVAEKLVVSAYALTLLAGVWYLTGAVRPGGSRWLAFLAFPFVFNYTFQFGFYNYSLSLALFPFVLGLWWRYRERPASLRYAVGINLLLGLCYFAHILSFGLALLAIAALWLATLRRDAWRRHLLHVAVLAPQAILPVWYFARQGGEVLPSYWPLARQVRYFAGLGAIPVFGTAQEWLAGLLAVTFLALLLFTLQAEGYRRAPGTERAFLLLATLFTLLFFVSPEGMSGGTILKPRLCLYPYLILIPWLAPPVSPRMRRLGVAALALVALLDLAYVSHRYLQLSSRMEEYLAGLDTVAPNTRVLPLLFARRAVVDSKVDVLSHAISYKALELGLVDWDNYEATYPFFPTEFRASAPPPPITDIEGRPGHLRVAVWSRRTDYVYTWQIPPEQPIVQRLQRYFQSSVQPSSGTHGGVLWTRRSN
ncbi:MAG TPA: hypothetical protein VIE43_13050 [Thermoanaerobaculia bacterium]|nr:hypothetical protein [Thermoanaerobaculia bacterium]